MNTPSPCASLITRRIRLLFDIFQEVFQCLHVPSMDNYPAGQLGAREHCRGTTLAA